ncbi:MAG TPA: cytochrome P450 [Solirubrobacteraceae bacterium]|nr:cytochrome P450 [Solirubrobacteraceae bacterium]
MALVTELDLPVLDYTDPALRGPVFHPRMAELRAQGWLAATPIGALVLEREAAELFLRSRSTTFPGRKLAELFGIEHGPLAEELRRNILCIDGDDHRRLRNLVNPAFTPRAADRWRPAMRTYLEELWYGVRDDGRCEFVEAFAKPYPSLVIATVMGAPLEDAPRLHHWSNWIQKQFDPEALMTQRELIEEAVVEFYAYADALLAARRDDPREDLVSTLLAAEADGDRLSDVECVNLVLNVLIGGVDTTQSQLAHAIRLFAEHPDQWSALRADPALAAGAVDEALRYEPITPFTARIVVEDMEVRGVAFPAGTVVLVAACTANRDGVADPDRFDIARTDGARVTTFGAGIHYCLGANLARAELQEALGFLARHIDRLELDGEPAYGSVNGIYGLDALPIRFEPA